MENTRTAIEIAEPKKERLAYIDNAKAIAIMIVVIYHCVLCKLEFGFTSKVASTLIYWEWNITNMLSFFLPFFFFATGLTYTPGKKTVKENIISRLKYLLVPSLLFYAMCTVPEIITRMIDGTDFLTTLKRPLIELLYWNNQFPVEVPAMDIFFGDFGLWLSSLELGTFWYVQTLIIASLAFYPLAELLRKDRSRHYHIWRGLTILGLIFLAGIKQYLINDIPLPFSIDKAPFALLIMLVALWLKDIKIYSIKSVWGNIVLSLACLALVIVAGGLASGQNNHCWGNYGNAPYFSLIMIYINNIAGSILWLQIGKLIALIKNKAITKAFEFVGKKTFAVFAFHMCIGTTIFWIIEHFLGQSITDALPMWGALLVCVGDAIVSVALSYPLGALLERIVKAIFKKDKLKQQTNQ